MRRQRVAASVALIVAFAAAAVPGSVGSQGPSPVEPIAPSLFREVVPAALDGTAATTPTLDPAYRAAGTLDDTTAVLDPGDRPVASGRPDVRTVQPDAALRTVAIPRPTPKPRPAPKPKVVAKPPTTSTASSTGGSWNRDPEVSWYGPGFYGNRTACGLALTKTLIGVAHRTLPCGTRITFRNPKNGRTVTARVVDRGPYVAGRQWDLTGGLCVALDHCYTGPILWRRG
jgi:rare lipoprotein A (RlpA)-like double-psi beta-barrel protein